MRVYNGSSWQDVAPVATSINLATQVTGTLAAGNGGTGITSPGTAGNVLTSTGSAWASSALPAGGLTYVVKTANYTTQDKQGVLADTSGGAFTVTLPATPAVGAQVVVADSGASWATNNLTVGRNGSTIGGLAQDLVCDITGASVQLVYDGTTWEVYAQIGGNGGTAVTLNGVQTLTNKTINGASNTLTVRLANDVTGTLPVANGGTGATSLTANNVILGNGTSAVQVVAPGSSGNVLTSNGTTWASTAPASGAMILLADIAPTAAANIDALNTFTSAYDTYVITLQDILAATSGGVIAMRFAVGGTADAGTNYRGGQPPQSGQTFGQASIGLLLGLSTLDDAGPGYNGVIQVLNANATNSSYKTGTISSFFHTDGTTNDFCAANGVFGYNGNGTSALSGVRFILTNGANFAAQGRIRIYGIKNT